MKINSRFACLRYDPHALTDCILWFIEPRPASGVACRTAIPPNRTVIPANIVRRSPSSYRHPTHQRFNRTLQSYSQKYFKKMENFRLPATWSLRTSEGTPITTNLPRKNHVPAPPKTQTPCKNAHSTTNKKRTPRNRSGFIAPQAVS